MSAQETTQPMRLCACGCGGEFEPRRNWQRYSDGMHRLRARQSRSTVVRLSKVEFEHLADLRNGPIMRCTTHSNQPMEPLLGFGTETPYQAFPWPETGWVE